MGDRTADSSITAIVRGLLDDVRELFREEVALARAEVRQELTNAKAAAIRFAIAAVLLAVGGLFILTFCALGLSSLLNWPAWAGFIIVGIVLAIVGAVLALSGRTRLERVGALPKTTESVKENAEWIKSRTSSENR